MRFTIRQQTAAYNTRGTAAPQLRPSTEQGTQLRRRRGDRQLDRCANRGSCPQFRAMDCTYGPDTCNTGRYGYLMMLVTIRLSSVAWRRPGLSGWGGPGGRFGVYFGGGLVSW